MTDGIIERYVAWMDGLWENYRLIRWITYLSAAHGVLILFAGAVLFFRGDL